MPNIKNAVKRVRTTKTKTLINSARKSLLKSTIKKCNEAVANNDANAANALKEAMKLIDKSAAKKIIHRNTAARRKSKLAKAVNAMAK
ncbi:MAG: 30S ribosomal protein S20 [Clostridium sp.]|nr:30S ribosomal protein S20 [Clostridium sp.]